MAYVYNPLLGFGLDNTGAGGGGGGASALDDLTDVVITSATNGQALVYNGTNWVNGAGGGSSAAGNLYLASQFT